MAKTSAQKITLTGLLVVGLARAALKILWIDPVTGFYPVHFALGTLFGLMLAVPALLCALALLRTRPRGTAALGGVLREFSSLVLGGAILVDSALLLLPLPRLMAGYAQLLSARTGAGALRVRLLLDVAVPLGRGLLGLGAGVSFVLYCLRYASGAVDRFSPLWAAVPAVWQCADALARFFTFGQPFTCSDQLLETLFLASCCVFFLYHGDAAIGGTLTGGACWLRLGACLTLYFGGVLLCGQLGGWVALGSAQSAGPSLLRCLYILILCVYCLIYSRSLPET